MNTITLPCSDATRFCRLCFSEINLLTVIGPSPAEQKPYQDLLHLMKSYLKLELEGSTDFPSAVCGICIGLLREFDSLYQNAQDYGYAVRVLLSEKIIEDVEEVLPVNKIEPTLVEIYEPNGENESIVEADQIVLEDVPLGESNQREEQIDVYHVDGQLQHIIMEGGTCIEVRTEGARKQPRKNLWNSSHAKVVAQPAPRKRTISPAAANLSHIPKKVPPKPTTLPATSSSRTLNMAATAKRQPQVVGSLKHTTPGSSKQLYRCNQCSNLFVELSNYYGHTCKKQTMANLGIGQKIQCKLCSMTYRSKLLYQKHEYEAHGIRNENFGIQCNICSKLFSQRQDYQLHMRVMHPKPGLNVRRVSIRMLDRGQQIVLLAYVQSALAPGVLELQRPEVVPQAPFPGAYDRHETKVVQPLRGVDGSFATLQHDRHVELFYDEIDHLACTRPGCDAKLQRRPTRLNGTAPVGVVSVVWPVDAVLLGCCCCLEEFSTSSTGSCAVTGTIGTRNGERTFSSGLDVAE
uniref:Uncharacterized protein n=1 Tax=Anopheles dirus TaxID=7168 RepID=A0A182NRT1_9DIPT